jgi:hypothetical protein
MIYELYLNGEKADVRQDLGVQLSFNIDDINKFGSRDTSFSKTIVLPGTANNNKLLGFVADMGSFNTFDAGAANIGANFNVAQTTKAELRGNGLLLIKGVFRLLSIVKDKDIIEYEGAVFGELGGFIASIGNGKLEELDFSDYDHVYNRDAIVNSWDTINGSGYYYPLIDYGTHSSADIYGIVKAKVDYNYLTFRPALYAKEYIDKIFSAGGYTYESTFLNSSFFKKLIIPNNQKGIFKKEGYNVQGLRTTAVTTTARNVLLSYENTTLSADWLTNAGKNEFTYIGSTAQTFDYSFVGTFTLTSVTDSGWSFEIRKNGVVVYTEGMSEVNGVQFTYEDTGTISVVTNDVITIRLIYPEVEAVSVIYDELTFRIFNSSNPWVEVTLNGDIEISQTIPKGIMQKDFFTWIIKMFNLYVTEDKERSNHLIIEPYIDYYGTDTIDWTYKVARDKAWQIKPMGMLNGRFFEYKFKEDSDFYNDGYKKKYNQSYGDRLEDTAFQFAKDKQTIDVGFSPSPLVQYNGTDKVLPAIYKRTKGNSVDQEELADSNIRILMAKKMSCSSWNIRNGKTTSSPNLGASLIVYGYAGHFDDPVNPTKDINFGAAEEIYFDPNSYTSNNLFNDYWSEYISEIADKDSKILSCYVHLTPLDIAQLDFSKAVMIDGIRFRLNKIEDFDYNNNELVRVELLKIINNG